MSAHRQCMSAHAGRRRQEMNKGRSVEPGKRNRKRKRRFGRESKRNRRGRKAPCRNEANE
eukprot:6207451-Pleurochrysis_carterae.AAC.1